MYPFTLILFVTKEKNHGGEPPAGKPLPLNEYTLFYYKFLYLSIVLFVIKSVLLPGKIYKYLIAKMCILPYLYVALSAAILGNQPRRSAKRITHGKRTTHPAHGDGDGQRPAEHGPAYANRGRRESGKRRLDGDGQRPGAAADTQPAPADDRQQPAWKQTARRPAMASHPDGEPGEKRGREGRDEEEEEQAAATPPHAVKVIIDRTRRPPAPAHLPAPPPLLPCVSHLPPVSRSFFCRRFNSAFGEIAEPRPE